MRVFKDHAEDVKIAYIGGGSRGWAWGLMSDLAQSDKLAGEVALYDIDRQAAVNNEIIGNKIGKGSFTYRATDTLQEALTGANFVVLSILPGTFDEMESDVHTPEKYGIYQSVGDTTGPGGIVRALRTLPMYVEIAEAIRDYSPNAWVINYTNPMTLCVATLYRVFPQIKAFGCCHEVFGTQRLLANILEEKGITEKANRSEIKVNPVGINHFTWLTSAQYYDLDLFPIYREYALEHAATGCSQSDENWMNNSFVSCEMVKMDLFLRFGSIAAAGDRHLAEFCPGNWYLKDPETVKSWRFGLTSVAWRKEDLKKRLEKSAKYLSGELAFEINETGEEGVKQIEALLGLRDLVTNVNLPNVGQIPNLPLGSVVETNAAFRADSVTPIVAGNVPDSVMGIMAPTVWAQRLTLDAALNKDFDLALRALSFDRLSDRLSPADAKAMLTEMIENTKKYLPGW